MANFITKHRKQIKVYNTVHSYAQYILLPWGFTKVKPPHYNKTMDLVKKVVSNKNAFKSIYFTNNFLSKKGIQKMSRVDGRTYKVLNIMEFTEGEVTPGSSTDWALGKAKIPHSMAMELRDKGDHGFELPPDQIISTSKEFLVFHREIGRRVLKEFSKVPIKEVLRKRRRGGTGL